MIMLHGKKLRVIVLSIKYCYPLLRIGKTSFFAIRKLSLLIALKLKAISIDD